MTPAEQTAALAAFSAVWAVLAVGHNVADHVFGQTDAQAEGKGTPSAEQIAQGASPHSGWSYCLAHVGLYHLVLAAVFALMWTVVPLQFSWWGLVLGFTWSAATHALLDRRWPVRWILQRLGSARFAELRSGGLNGIYLADQALHHGALMISAALITQM